MKENELKSRQGILESSKLYEGVRIMHDRAWTWTARLAALMVAVIIPACNNSGAGTPAQGILWNSRTTTGGGGAPIAGQQLWINPNLAVPGPIGIIGIGGVEITFGDADATAYPPGSPEAPHPVSTSRSLDPQAEAIVNSLVQQLFQPNINQGGNQQVNLGPSLLTGDSKLGGLSRAHSKHRTLHAGAIMGPGLAVLMNYCTVNPNRIAPVMYNAAGPGITPTQAGNQIAAAANGYVQGITTNAFGAAGYWTSGIDNYYAFTMCQVTNGAP